MARCSKIIGNRRCKVPALKGKKYCLFHSKQRASGGGEKPFRATIGYTRKKRR